METTHTRCDPLVSTDILCVKHEFRTLVRFLDPRATRNKESDSLLERMLVFNAHSGAKFDAQSERVDPCIDMLVLRCSGLGGAGSRSSLHGSPIRHLWFA